MIGSAIQPLDRETLDFLANPQSNAGGESIPYILYDTQTFTTAVTTEMQFFRAAVNDDTLSNMQAGGTLPDPYYFQLFNLGFDILQDASTAAGDKVGVLDNIQKLMLVGKSIFTLSISDKSYGPYPLSFLHTSGGAAGTGYGSFTAEESIQVGNNSFPDGGWNWSGSVIIPPRVNFGVKVRWQAVQAVVGGPIPCRFWISGILHRRVL
jgi:hypothetical protein